MSSYHFHFRFISTINNGNEPFPLDVLEPELSNIDLKSGTFYDFNIGTISTCSIYTLTVM